ncbi:MAG: glycoside hydrolase family 88 protein [Nibricoccus sp.]
MPLTSTSESVSTEGLQKAYDLCVAKTHKNIQILADSPKTTYSFDKDGCYSRWPEGFFEIGNWTTSFFTGMALLAYESTHDSFFLKQLNRLTGVYTDKITRASMDTMHDLGFLYSLYSVGLWKITGSTEHRNLALKAAEELAKRYIPKGEYIRAWGRTDDNRDEYAGLAIIDCLMNLPLLFWASRETGNPFFHEIAIKHADTTAKSFVRKDYSVCHAYRFDLTTGQPDREDNYCGAGIGSHWARGTAWAVYGYSMTARYTGESRYRDLSQKIAERFLSLLDGETVPLWDFRIKTDIRDSSAASIMACGLYDLAEHGSSTQHFARYADTLLGKLTKDYVNYDLNIHGVLTRAQVGDGIDKDKNVKGREVYTSWGDYFLMEALARKLRKQKPYW